MTNESLQPGAKAPQFLPPVPIQEEKMPSGRYSGRPLVLIFFPADSLEGMLAVLGKYGQNLHLLEEREAGVIGISDAAPEQLRQLAGEGIAFPLLSDQAGDALSAYGVLDAAGKVQPTIYIIDDAEIVRSVYAASRYPDLPAPPIVARALRKLNAAPKPLPVTPEDWQLGSPDASAVLIEYSDYQCPHCAQAHAVIRQLEAIYGDRLLVVHRHLPLRHSHPRAQMAAEAAEASGAQGKFWEMHDRLFAAGFALERADLIAYATELGLDIGRFIDDLDGRRHQEAVNDDFQAAVRNGIKLPPTLFINGVLFDGPHTKEALCKVIDQCLACGQR